MESSLNYVARCFVLKGWTIKRCLQLHIIHAALSWWCGFSCTGLSFDWNSCDCKNKPKATSSGTSQPSALTSWICKHICMDRECVLFACHQQTLVGFFLILQFEIKHQQWTAFLHATHLNPWWRVKDFITVVNELFDTTQM